MAEPTDSQVKLQRAKAAFLQTTADCDPVGDLVKRHPMAVGALALGLGLAFGKAAKTSAGSGFVAGVLKKHMGDWLTKWIGQRFAR